MKTLIIAGTYKRVNAQPTELGGVSFNVHYNVSLFAQSPEQPLIHCIGFIEGELSGYDELQAVARRKYCDWYGVDEFNIVSMDVLNPAAK
jgi:hypothetical protein